MNDLIKNFPITSSIVNRLRNILFDFKSVYIIVYEIDNKINNKTIPPSLNDYTSVIDITITFIRREDYIKIKEDFYIAAPGKGVTLKHRHEYSTLTEEHLTKALFDSIDIRVSTELLKVVTLMRDDFSRQSYDNVDINSISFRTMCETREIKI
jgi:hypothetical protein